MTTPLRTVGTALLVFTSCVLAGAFGVVAAQTYFEYASMRASYPQVIQLLNAHEVALQKLTGAPTIAPPTPAK